MTETTPEYLIDNLSTGERHVSIQKLSDPALLLSYENAKAWVEHYKLMAGHVEQEIHRRMEVSGGTMIPSEEFVCELQTRNVYDQLAFVPLKEVLSDMDLAKHLAFTTSE